MELGPKIQVSLVRCLWESKARNVEGMLSRLHALVIGCGLGKDATVRQAALHLCESAAMQGASICFGIFNLKWMGCLRCFWKHVAADVTFLTPGLPVVLDADGLEVAIRQQQGI